jgi:hypothetical protein
MRKSFRIRYMKCVQVLLGKGYTDGMESRGTLPRNVVGLREREGTFKILIKKSPHPIPRIVGAQVQHSRVSWRSP